MSLPGGDRIKETSATQGTASFVLTGAVSGEGVRAFAASEDAQHIRYFAKHVTADEAESGYGVYTHSTKTLTRLYRYYPSRGAAAVNFSAGGLEVACTGISGDFLVWFDTTDPTVNDDVTAGFLAGMEWINTAAAKVFKLLSHGAGAADWDQINATAGGTAPSIVATGAGTFALADANRFHPEHKIIIADAAVDIEVPQGATPGDVWKVHKTTAAAVTVSNNGDVGSVNGGSSVALPGEAGATFWIFCVANPGSAPVSIVEGETAEASKLIATLDAADELIKQPLLGDYAEKLATLSISSGTVTWNLETSEANVAELELTENLPSGWLTINNWPASGVCGTVSMRLIQDGTGSRTVDWTGLDFGDDGAPTMPPTASTGVLWITGVTIDGGTTVEWVRGFKKT